MLETQLKRLAVLVVAKADSERDLCMNCMNIPLRLPFLKGNFIHQILKAYQNK